MKLADKKYWAAFTVGILWGALIVFVIGFLYLRHSLITEEAAASGFDETVKGLQENISKAKGWTVKPVVCALPVTSDKCRMRIFKLCKGIYAKEMLDSPESRKASAIIPCTVAIYEKPDGKTYIARLNGSLAGIIIGGKPAGLFPSKICPEQKAVFSSLIAK